MHTPQRVIFLDLDGVMMTSHSRRLWQEGVRRGTTLPDKEGWFRSLDTRAVAALGRIVTATGAGLVITSSLRHGLSVGELRRLFHAHGLAEHVHDKLHDAAPGDRGTQIDAWLSWQADPPRFVVVDDLDDGISRRFAAAFVRCEDEAGLGDPEAEALVLDLLTRP